MKLTNFHLKYLKSENIARIKKSIRGVVVFRHSEIKAAYFRREKQWISTAYKTFIAIEIFLLLSPPVTALSTVLYLDCPIWIQASVKENLKKFDCSWLQLLWTQTAKFVQSVHRNFNSYLCYSRSYWSSASRCQQIEQPAIIKQNGGRLSSFSTIVPLAKGL